MASNIALSTGRTQGVAASGQLRAPHSTFENVSLEGFEEPVTLELGWRPLAAERRWGSARITLPNQDASIPLQVSLRGRDMAGTFPDRWVFHGNAPKVTFLFDPDAPLLEIRRRDSRNEEPIALPPSSSASQTEQRDAVVRRIRAEHKETIESLRPKLREALQDLRHCHGSPRMTSRLIEDIVTLAQEHVPGSFKKAGSALTLFGGVLEELLSDPDTRRDLWPEVQLRLFLGLSSAKVKESTAEPESDRWETAPSAETSSPAPRTDSHIAADLTTAGIVEAGVEILETTQQVTGFELSDPRLVGAHAQSLGDGRELATTHLVFDGKLSVAIEHLLRTSTAGLAGAVVEGVSVHVNPNATVAP